MAAIFAHWRPRKTTELGETGSRCCLGMGLPVAGR